MRVRAKFGAMMIAGVLAASGVARGQEMQMPGQEQHHPMQMAVIKPEYPRMGRAQEKVKGALVTLGQVQKIASDSNPTLRQAEAEIRTAKARQQQAGLYPNPTVVYTGDEIRGGSVGGGKQGFFVQQTIVTGRKLGLSRDVFGRDVKLAEMEAEEQKMRVQSAVKMAFLRVLAAQELRDARRDMAAIAQDAAEVRAQTVLDRARREATPDVQVRGGMEYNHELLGSVPFAKGWEGIAEVAVQIPLFNRNQGNVTAARADIERAGQEKKRIALTLRERAASAIDQYANARLMALEYRDEMLPRAKKAYALMVEKYGQMLASYPRVLDTQRKLYELQIEYIAVLESVWTNGIALQGYLLTDGLEAPARPGEVDRPIRETNVPMPERTMSPRESMRNP